MNKNSFDLKSRLVYFRIFRYFYAEIYVFLHGIAGTVMFFLYENSHEKLEHAFLKAKISSLLENIVSYCDHSWASDRY